jgi:AraC-like DNA-binding protein
MKERWFMENLEGVIPDLSHIGVADHRRAQEPLYRHFHPHVMEFVYVDSGSIHYEIENEAFLINGGELITTWPGEKHGTGGLPEEKVKFSWLGLKLSGETSFLGEQSSEVMLLKESLVNLKRRHFKCSKSLQAEFKEIGHLLKGKQDYSQLMLRSRLFLLLIKIVKDSAEHGVVEKKRFDSAIQIIQEKYCQKINLDSLAEASDLSLSHFKKEFKKDMGVSPYEYIIQKRIDKAKKLLAEKKLSITEIAYQLGYATSQHFATQFKKYTHFSPQQYRK